MAYYNYILHTLTEEDLLCQLAEEASELSQAALKLRRAITHTNPTPVSESDAEANLIEEMADVIFCCNLIEVKRSMLVGDREKIRTQKTERWAKRLGWTKETDICESDDNTVVD